MNRNKMTNTTLTGALGSSKSSHRPKLRTELRRVMSDRVMKITQYSQQQQIDKVKQKKNEKTLSPKNTFQIHAAADVELNCKQKLNETDVKISENLKREQANLKIDSSPQKEEEDLTKRNVNKICLLPIKKIGNSFENTSIIRSLLNCSFRLFRSKFIDSSHQDCL
jgi:hypothetical protein